MDEKNMNIRYLFTFVVSLIYTSNVYAVVLPNNITNNNIGDIDSVQSDFLDEFKDCNTKYHEKMKQMFEQYYKIKEPNTDDQNSCKFISTNSFIDVASIILGLYGSPGDYLKYIDDAKDCKKFLDEDTIHKDCINSSQELIPYFQYEAIMNAYKVCMNDYISIQMKAKDSDTKLYISDVMSERDNVNVWIEKVLKESTIIIDSAFQIIQEEKKAAQIIQPICNIANTVKTILDKTQIIRQHFIEWIPMITTRQLRDGQ